MHLFLVICLKWQAMVHKPQHPRKGATMDKHGGPQEHKHPRKKLKRPATIRPSKAQSMCIFYKLVPEAEPDSTSEQRTGAFVPKGCKNKHTRAAKDYV
jgi:hypothetical protein